MARRQSGFTRAATIKNLITNVDADGDGNVSWNEFIAAKAAGSDMQIPAGAGKVIGDIVIYITFMVIFTLLTTRDLSNPNIFHFGNNIQGQFAGMASVRVSPCTPHSFPHCSLTTVHFLPISGVEMKSEHSPSWGKNFEDVATVEEAYHWMLGPFIHTAFRPNTFDGDLDWKYSATKGPEGYTLGYGKIMGGIRISQVRSKKIDCNPYVSPKMTNSGGASSFNFSCYGSTEWGRMGDFDLATEDQDSYSNFTYGGASASSTGNAAVFAQFNPDGSTASRGAFAFDGITATGQPLVETVDELRAKYLSSFTSKYFLYYPAPAFAVTMSPLLGYENATAVVEDLIRATYIDLHTRAVFIDLSVYNPHLDRVCFCRLIFELTSAGGVIPSEFFRTIRLWRSVTAEDAYYQVLVIVVSVFYAYYMYDLYLHWKRAGWSVFKEFLYVAQFCNFVFWFIALGCEFHAESLFPTNMDLDSEQYIDMLPSVQFKVTANYISAVNVFLNWIRLIDVLSYSSTFGLIWMTLTESAKGVSGFMVVFFTIMFGFAQAHCMCFQTGLSDFKTLGDTIFTLMRSLLGDFDFTSMQEEGPIIGPLLFVSFVGLAVFVVLNMLIAIISDAYEESKNQMSQKPKVNLLADVRDYLVFKLLLNPRLHGFVEKFLPGWLGKAIDQYAGVSKKIVPSADQVKKLPTGEGAQQFEVTASGSLMLELEQVHNVTGQLKGAVVCTEPVHGPLVGRVTVDDLLVSIDGESVLGRPLNDIGRILTPKKDDSKVLVFERVARATRATEGGGEEDELSEAERMNKKVGKIEKDIAGMAANMEQLQKQMAAMLQLMGTKPQLRV
jgi:hypothetical protein